MKPRGNFEGIHYVYTSDDPFRRDSFIKRNFLKIKGSFNELIVLREMKKAKKLNYAILSTHSFGAIFYYFILSKLFGFKKILNIEYFSDAKMKWPQLGKWINDNLHYKYAPLLVDISFPISEFLIDRLKKITP